MDDDNLRRALAAHFERDIGSPPPGARERVLGGLHETAERSRRHLAAWTAAIAAVLIGVLAVAALLATRGVRQAQPAGPPQAPAARSGAAIAYDPARGVAVMFGGTRDGTTALGDTWTWDGARWTRLHPAVSPSLEAFGPVAAPGGGTKPQSFPGLLMAYDAGSRSLVLYGIPGSTWTWDGRNWRGHPTSPPQKGTNGDAAMAYDPASRGILLFVAPAGRGGQTWRWDGQTWTQLHPRTTPDVVSGAMASDGRRPLLFGSTAGLIRGQNLTQTWAWDGADWSLLAPPTRLPPSSYAAAYDQEHGRLIVVTKVGASVSETWFWDGTSWGRLHPRHEPTAGAGAVAWYDARTKLVALYGGLRTGTREAPSELWTWDGNDWTLMEGTTR